MKTKMESFEDYRFERRDNKKKCMINYFNMDFFFCEDLIIKHLCEL